VPSDTKGVIIAAVGIFIVLNMIMWTAVGLINRRKRIKRSKKSGSVPEVSLPVSSKGDRILLIQPDRQNELQKAFTVHKNIPPTDPKLLQAKQDNSFRIIRSDIIVHTKDKL